MSQPDARAPTLTVPAPDAIAASRLAGRIEVPRRLPPRYDGEPLQHLSHSSYTRFICCPEDWRRHYLVGERFAPTGSMFLGGRVDDALTLYSGASSSQATGSPWSR